MVIVNVAMMSSRARQVPPKSPMQLTSVFGALTGFLTRLPLIGTIYRLRTVFGESGERRAQRAPIQHAGPMLLATAPNQV